MELFESLTKLRAKKLAALILDARLKSEKSEAECAACAGLSLEQYQQVEKGRQALSLPQLELLAYHLDIPLDHFWGDQVLQALPIFETGQAASLAEMRNQEIGQLLTTFREAAGLSSEQLAEQLEMPPAELESYESGNTPIPLPMLEKIAAALNQPLAEFYPRDGEIGIWIKKQQFLEQYLGLPEELQQFILKPINRPYLELAVRLSNLSVAKLRAVAEGLLEITY